MFPDYSKPGLLTPDNAPFKWVVHRIFHLFTGCYHPGEPIVEQLKLPPGCHHSPIPPTRVVLDPHPGECCICGCISSHMYSP